MILILKHVLMDIIAHKISFYFFRHNTNNIISLTFPAVCIGGNWDFLVFQLEISLKAKLQPTGLPAWLLTRPRPINAPNWSLRIVRRMKPQRLGAIGFWVHEVKD